MGSFSLLIVVSQQRAEVLTFYFRESFASIFFNFLRFSQLFCVFSSLKVSYVSVVEGRLFCGIHKKFGHHLQFINYILFDAEV